MGNTGEKDANGRIVNCAGYAFVHTKTVQQAQEMMKRRTIKIGKLNAEIKPYDQAKREASQTRYREKQRSSNSTSSQAINNQTNPPSDVEDWTITNENTHWDPTQVKLANLEPDSFVFPESAYCSDANDETMSLSQSIINSEAGRHSVRGKPAALKMEPEQTDYVNMALKTFKDNDETPTVEKINAKISEWTGRNQAMVREQNPIEEETPVATFTQLNGKVVNSINLSNFQNFHFKIPKVPRKRAFSFRDSRDSESLFKIPKVPRKRAVSSDSHFKVSNFESVIDS